MSQFYIWLTSVCEIATFAPVEEACIHIYSFYIPHFLYRIAGANKTAFTFSALF
jgi:hypothetical protein